MFSRNLAFITGINNYTNGISPLNTAVNDAKKLVEILREKHDYEVWECLDEVATLSNFHKFLSHTLPEQVTENDRLLFYFAGHGVALNGDDGPAGYLIPQDALLGDTNSYLPMTKLHDALSQLPCRHFLGILDCCFAGAFKWSSTRDLLTSPEVIHQERYDRFITDPAWQIITSSASDQKALDNFNLDSERSQVGNHSPFASALLEALEGGADIYPPATNGKPPGDGVITATELYLYLRDRVEIPTEKCRIRQTPGIWCLNKHDKGEYIFLSPGHELNLPPAPPLDESQNPYRGLKSFDEKHSSLFFGRTLLVEKLEDFVKANPLTVVLGASGSGKSSLVKAGLIPKLRQGNTEKWCILPPIRPGETPLQGLNNALKNSQLPEVAAQNPQQNLAMSIDVWAKNNPNSKLLLFIDQSEEIITLCQNLDERQAFFQQILTAINTHGDKLRVVLTLRSDFEPQVRDAGLTFVPTDYNVGLTVLKKCWHNGRFIVPAMTRGELREAIEKPAQARVMYFQPHDLVEELIDEVADMPGALPLLSFALSELYLKYLRRQREEQYRGITIDRALTQADYIELGGVMQSLTQRADEEYKALVNKNPAYDQVIRHVMLRMVALGGGELARRRVPLSELEYPPGKNDLVKEVIERFSTARLLVKGQDAEGNPYVEPAHDALVRGWQRLLEWKHLEEENLLLQRRLTPAAVEWKNLKSKKQSSGFEAKAEAAINWLNGRLDLAENFFNKINTLKDTQLARLWQRTPEQQKGSRDKTVQFLWNANPYLDVLNKELNSDDNWLNQVEAEFVQRSVRQKSINTRRNWGVAIAVMLGLGTGLVLSTYFGLESRKQAIQAINAALQAQANQVKSSILLKPTTEDLIQAIESIAYIQDNQKSLQPTVINEMNSSFLAALDKVRERNRLQGHTDIVTDIAFSPDGKQILSGSFDNTVRLWDTETGQTLHTLEGHTDTVNAIAFSPDGKQILSGSRDDTVRLWDTETGTLIHTLEGHTNTATDIAFSPDGKQILSGSGDGTLRLWDTETGQTLHTLEGHTEDVYEIAFSRDGKQILSGSGDGTLRLWDTETGTLIHTLEGHTNTATDIAFSPDSKPILSSDSWDNTLLWDTDSGQPFHIEDHTDDVYGIAFSPDGKQILSGSGDGTLRLWDTETGQTLHTDELEGHTDFVTDIAFSPDGKQILSGSLDSTTVRLWDTKSRTLIHTLEGHTSWVSAIAFSPDGKQILSGSDDGAVRLWDTDSGTLIHTLEGHTSWVSAIAFSPDGKQILSDSDDNTVRLWDTETGLPLHTLEGHTEDVTAIAFSRDGKQILSASSDDTVRLWDTETSQPLHTLEGHTEDVTAIAFSRDGKQILSASSDDTVRLWDTETGLTLHTLQGHTEDVTAIAFSRDGKQILSGSSDDTVRLWDTETGLPLHTLKGHTSAVNDIAFSRDGKQILSGSGDGTLRLWDTETGQTLHTLQGHIDGVWAIAFSRDGKQILSGSGDKTLRLWDTETGQHLHTLEGHTTFVNEIAFSRDGKQILSGSWDNTVRLWDTETGLALHTLQGHTSRVTDIAFSRDGKQILSASGDGTVRLWLGLDWRNLLKEGCDQLQFHPDLVAPQNNKAGEVCLKYAGWEDKAKADFLVRQGRAFVLQKEPNIKSAVKKFKEAQKLYPDIDLNPYTEEIDKDPKIVAHLLAAQAKVLEGAILAKEGKIERAISAYQEAQKLNLDIDLNPDTEEIDKDPKIVAHLLAAQAKVLEGAILAIYGKIQKAISAYQEAQKLNPDIDLNPNTKEIDKDPKTVARKLAPDSE
ncbi:nSTAND1 domain-containing NTPase [Moorena bouillonii]|uniref:nSTAND1 domain-containing NTPase n=1 Tax=Moorena bouillonii TaxID=207920 RepID=UPI000AC8EEC4|nr:caspase family protein [Moorena bouillonii]